MTKEEDKKKVEEMMKTKKGREDISESITRYVCELMGSNCFDGNAETKEKFKDHFEEALTYFFSIPYGDSDKINIPQEIKNKWEFLDL
jgi:hypothetical protein